jgi:alkylmercury lyase-like protein
MERVKRGVDPRAPALHSSPVTVDARALRTHIYDWILARGVPPTSGEIGAALRTDAAEIRRALRELKIGKTVLVSPDSGEIWMAGPFSAVETPYHVLGSRVRWFANCAWDMFGVATLANESVRIETRCTDCSEPIELRVDPGRMPSEAGVVHFLVPARRWYEDIGFT